MCTTAMARRRWSSGTRPSATFRCTSIRGIPARAPRTSAVWETSSMCRGRPASPATCTCATCWRRWTRRSRMAGGGRICSSCRRVSTRWPAIRWAGSRSSPRTWPSGRRSCASGWRRRRSSDCSRAATGSISSPPVHRRTCAHWRDRPRIFRCSTEDSMALKLAADVIALKTKHRFVIARGGDDAEGWGEADPSRYYGETADTVLAVVKRLEPYRPKDPFDLEAAEATFARVVPQNGAARAALSAALHDLVGKRLGQPMWRLWGLDPTRAPRSSFTIGLDTVEKMRQKVAEASSYPILKVKLGTERDEQILRAIRDATDKPIRVDVNAGWTRERAIQMLPILKEYGVEFVEQPLPPHDLEGLADLRRRGILPVVVDESCIVAGDIPRLAGVVDGINIKLAKCGSLREALRMIATARAHGMLVMVGCMIESSLGITAAAHFAPLLDCADLDGAALTANDPFAGATIEGGRIRLPTGPGLGVRRRE